MAKKTVVVCDICGATLGVDAYLFGPVPVGHSFDGHRNEEDTVSLDLCPKHYQDLCAAIDYVAGLDNHTAGRIFSREHAEAAIVLFLSVWRGRPLPESSLEAAQS